MFSVGLTGGIASGKTTLSNLFAKLGVPIIDTDIISRELLEPGEPGFEQIHKHFGTAIMDADKRIDRAKLREIVFSSAVEKAWLETTLHPLIYRRSHEAIIQYAATDYVLLVVPLLFETNFQALVDRILAIDCSPEIQLQRLTLRDQIDEALARKMIAQQMSNSDRLARAHDVIENSDNTVDLEPQVRALHQLYLQLASDNCVDRGPWRPAERASTTTSRKTRRKITCW